MTIDYKHIWLAIKDSDMRYMSAAGIIFFLINFLIIWRWRILMKAVGLKSKRTFQHALVFYWTFLQLGADIYRRQ